LVFCRFEKGLSAFKIELDFFYADAVAAASSS
jgi:hypothetical protein